MARTMTTDTVLQKRLLDHLRTAVMMLDGDLRVRYLNP
ncbi:MAG TPA: PAS domain-containing sensor histidine kinase, partial [Alcanivorax sp.]|nr:PAS domain-containing sensor histidine kinase [Alcanivorax sp.]HBP76742.1 PAS domain-containing sensor histidine kinase [Alcanivorax sp.]